MNLILKDWVIIHNALNAQKWLIEEDYADLKMPEQTLELIASIDNLLSKFEGK